MIILSFHRKERITEQVRNGDEKRFKAGNKKLIIHSNKNQQQKNESSSSRRNRPGRQQNAAGIGRKEFSGNRISAGGI